MTVPISDEAGAAPKRAIADGAAGFWFGDSYPEAEKCSLPRFVGVWTDKECHFFAAETVTIC